MHANPLPFLYSYGAMNFHVRGANCVPNFLQLHPVAQNYCINSPHIMGRGRNSLKIGTAELHKNRNCRTPQEPELSDTARTGTVRTLRNRNCRIPEKPELNCRIQERPDSTGTGTVGLHRNRNCRTPQKPALSDPTGTGTVGLHRNRNCRTPQLF